MTLKEAIKVNNAMLDNELAYAKDREREAVRLGVEAMKEVQWLRRTLGAKVAAKLEGETLE